MTKKLELTRDEGEWLVELLESKCIDKNGFEYLADNIREIFGMISKQKFDNLYSMEALERKIKSLEHTIDQHGQDRMYGHF